MTTPVVLVTGALTGIGRATALAFAREASPGLTTERPVWRRPFRSNE
jgi:NAD(P)-dependent dehydrogenase (short-subunit alcohol dehydrogenase family)